MLGPRRSTGPASPTAARAGAPPLRATAATAGTSTSTSCRAAAVAAAVRPVRRPRPLHGRCRMTRCAGASTLPRRARDVDLPGGRITALLQARVLGYVFNPLSLFWCHDADGVLRARHRRGAQHLRQRHAYLLPPATITPRRSQEALRVAVQRRRRATTWCARRAGRRPWTSRISLHRDNQPAFVATMRGTHGVRRHRPNSLGCSWPRRWPADGRPAHPRAGHHAVAAPGAGGAAMTIVARGRHSSCDRSGIAGRMSTTAFRRGPVANALSARRRRSGLLRRAAARLPLRLVYPDGTVDRRRRPDPADPGAAPTRRAGPPRRQHRPDRVRRVLHGRRVDVRRSRRRAHRVRRRRWPTSCPRPLQRTAPDRAGPSAASRSATAEIRPAATSPSTTTCPTTSSPSSSTRRMTYSSALFDTLPATPADLADAQRRKIDRLLDAARVGPAPGCSRSAPAGANCACARPRGARRSARSRCRPSSNGWPGSGSPRPGCHDRVDIELCDYRDVDGRYDAVISVEMIEAVGYRVLADLLPTLDRLVTPGGRVAIQAITMPHDRMLASRNTHTWIQKYIFPGGLLPSTEAIMADHRPAHRAAHRRHVLAAPALRRDAAAVAGALHRATRYGGGRWASTMSSNGCGSSTWRTPRPVSGRSISTSTSGRSHRRRTMVNFLVVSVSSLAAVIVVFGITFAVGRRIGRYNVVDVTWGLAFVAVAAVAAAVGTGDLFRRLLLLILVAVWGLRLAWHHGPQARGPGRGSPLREPAAW